MMTLANARAPYFVGIGGSGVSAIVRHCLASGRPVGGTDLVRSVITDGLVSLGADVHIGPPPSAAPPTTDLIVSSDAVPQDLPLRRDAKTRGLTWLTYAAALGQLTDQFKTRAVVTGTNGKSTTTALLAWLLVQARRDPTVVVGSLVPQLGGNFRPGQSDLVVVEGDDYRDHFLELTPTLAVVTNVAFDHPDAFRDAADVLAHVRRFVGRLTPGGSLVLNADDEPLAPLRDEHRTAHTFSTRPDCEAEVHLVRADNRPGHQRFRFLEQGVSAGEGSLRLPGDHNLSNAAAAALAARLLGVPIPHILEGLASFRGLWRRFEIIRAGEDRVIVSDYAHHPDSVRLVIAAARAWYPGWRVVAAFQPHHEDRLVALGGDFAAALNGADEVLVTEVYRVAGRRSAARVSAESLADALRERGRPSTFYPDLEALRSAAAEPRRTKTVFLFLGAGSIDQIARTFA